MVQKKINITIDENLLKDIDALIKGGFYDNRTEVIEEGLLLIAPLKMLKEKRKAKKWVQMAKSLKTLMTLKPPSEMSQKLEEMGKSHDIDMEKLKEK